MGLTRNLTPHTKFTLRESAGMFTRLTGLEGLRQTVPFDISTTFTPTAEFYDDRTVFSSSLAALTFQRSTRLSFSLGGGFFLVDHRAAGLYGTRGGDATANVQYRIGRRSTIGALYQFANFRFTGIFGDTYMHAAAGSYSHQFTRTVEASGFFGLMRPESTFVQTVPVDPALAALIGINTARFVVYTKAIRPFWGARLARAFHQGVAYVSAGQSVVPGNGVFLTSYVTQFLGGYTYSGLRRWSFTMHGFYADAKSIGNVAGQYSTTVGGISVSRQIAPTLHWVARYSLRLYSSPGFENYNRWSNGVAMGLAFSPRDLPLRL